MKGGRGMYHSICDFSKCGMMLCRLFDNVEGLFSA